MKQHIIQKNEKCERFSHIDENGNQVFKPKKKFNNDIEAIEEARRKNAEEHQIHKLVAYKCKTCGFWHIGRTNKIITEKERQHYQNIGFKTKSIITSKKCEIVPSYKKVILSVEDELVLKHNLSKQNL